MVQLKGRNNNMNDENKALGFAKARSFAIRCSEGNVDFNSIKSFH